MPASHAGVADVSSTLEHLAAMVWIVTIIESLQDGVKRGTRYDTGLPRYSRRWEAEGSSGGWRSAKRFYVLFKVRVCLIQVAWGIEFLLGESPFDGLLAGDAVVGGPAGLGLADARKYGRLLKRRLGRLDFGRGGIFGDFGGDIADEGFEVGAAGISGGDVESAENEAGALKIDVVADDGVDGFHERGLDGGFVLEHGHGMDARPGRRAHATNHALVKVAENLSAKSGRAAADSVDLDLRTDLNVGADCHWS